MQWHCLGLKALLKAPNEECDVFRVPRMRWIHWITLARERKTSVNLACDFFSCSMTSKTIGSSTGVTAWFTLKQRCQVDLFVSRTVHMLIGDQHKRVPGAFPFCWWEESPCFMPKWPSGSFSLQSSEKRGSFRSGFHEEVRPTSCWAAGCNLDTSSDPVALVWKSFSVVEKVSIFLSVLLIVASHGQALDPIECQSGPLAPFLAFMGFFSSHYYYMLFF